MWHKVAPVMSRHNIHESVARITVAIMQMIAHTIGKALPTGWR